MPWASQFLRGGALAGLAGGVVFGVALLTGLTGGPPISVYPVAGIAAVIFALTFALIPDREATPQILGVLAVGVVALLAGVTAGFGALSLSGVGGSVLGVTLSGRRTDWWQRIPPAAVASMALAVVVASLIPLVLDGGGLNHDESAYALKARHWIEGTPETGWNLHRGIAMSGYGYLVFQVGGDERALRFLGLAAIVGLAIATWILGSRIGGRWVGPLSAVAVLSSPSVLRRSTEFLSDVPSSALLMAGMVVIWKQFGERDEPGYGLFWLLPFAWAAFYIRYQSVLSFGLIVLMIGLLFWEKVKKGWRPVAAASTLGVLGLIPHFVFAGSEEGNPLGIILFTAEVAGREFYGEGLVDYFLLMAWPLAAFVGPVAVVFFVWWLVVGWDHVTERTKCLFLMIPAAGQVLILGVLSHGEARFIFFPLALTLIGGVVGFLHVQDRWEPATARVTGLALAVLLFGSLAMASTYVREAVENRARGTEVIVAAAHEVEEMSGAKSCGVMTSYFPQVTYFSSCHTHFFRPELDPEGALSRVDGELRYLLVVEDGKNQPEGDDLSELIELTVEGPIVIHAGGQSAEIYRFGP
ncbi:MAG TPA: hypothetical protein VK969_08165 [Acidimicrobiia bacterium]|nr:hypothetical protein [Acidimicrobiia bacterium]